MPASRIDSKGHYFNEPLEEKLSRFTDRSGECWIWTGCISGSRDPRPQMRDPLSRRTRLASRVAWEVTYGPIPPGMFICHLCDNGKCVRPDHLFIGTQKDNIQDAARKGRLALGSRHGQSKLSADDVREIRHLSSIGRSRSDIARVFNVSRWTICDIIKGRCWGWLE